MVSSVLIHFLMTRSLISLYRDQDVQTSALAGPSFYFSYFMTLLEPKPKPVSALFMSSAAEPRVIKDGYEDRRSVLRCLYHERLL